MADSSAIRAGRAFVELGTDDTQFLRGLDKAKKTLSAWGTAMRNIGARAFAFGTAGFGGLFGAVKVFTTIGADLARAAQRIGITVEALSQLKFAAEQNGISFESLERDLRRMQRSMGRAAEGTPEVVGALRQLGLSFEDLNKLSPEGKLKALADAMQKIPDGTQKANVAMQLFGQHGMGTSLIPLLDLGSKGIDKLMRQFDDMGLTMSTKTAAQALELDQRLNVLWTVIRGGAITIGSALTPAFRYLANGLTVAIVAVNRFVKAHEKLAQIGGAVALGLTGSLLAGSAALIVFGTATKIVAFGLGGVIAAFKLFSGVAMLHVTIYKTLMSVGALAFGPILRSARLGIAVFGALLAPLGMVARLLGGGLAIGGAALSGLASIGGILGRGGILAVQGLIGSLGLIGRFSAVAGVLLAAPFRFMATYGVTAIQLISTRLIGLFSLIALGAGRLAVAGIQGTLNVLTRVFYGLGVSILRVAIAFGNLSTRLAVGGFAVLANVAYRIGYGFAFLTTAAVRASMVLSRIIPIIMLGVGGGITTIGILGRAFVRLGVVAIAALRPISVILAFAFAQLGTVISAALSPIGLLVIAIGAVGAAIAWAFSTNGQAAIGRFASSLSSFVGPVLNAIKSVLRTIGDLLGWVFGQNTMPKFLRESTSVFNTLGAVASGVLNYIGGAFGTMWNYAASAGKAAGSYLIEVFHRLWDAIKFVFQNSSSLSEAWGVAMHEAALFGTLVWIEAKGAIITAWAGIGAVFQQAGNDMAMGLMSSMHVATAFIATAWHQAVANAKRAAYAIEDLATDAAHQGDINADLKLQASLKQQVAEGKLTIAQANKLLESTWTVREADRRKKRDAGITQELADENNATEAEYKAKQAALAKLYEEQTAATAAGLVQKQAEIAAEIAGAKAAAQAAKQKYEEEQKNRHGATGMGALLGGVGGGGETSLLAQAKSLWESITGYTLPKWKDLQGDNFEAMKGMGPAGTFQGSAAFGLGTSSNPQLSKIATATTDSAAALQELLKKAAKGGIAFR